MKLMYFQNTGDEEAELTLVNPPYGSYAVPAGWYLIINEEGGITVSQALPGQP